LIFRVFLCLFWLMHFLAEFIRPLLPSSLFSSAAKTISVANSGGGQVKNHRAVRRPKAAGPGVKKPICTKVEQWQVNRGLRPLTPERRRGPLAIARFALPAIEDFLAN